MATPQLPPQVEEYRKNLVQDLNQIEAQTKVNKVYIAIAGVVFVAISVLFNVLHVFTTNIIATVVPAIRFLDAARRTMLKA
ncbi:hypothetical protein BCR33DRAFT_853730 [Rhizoclosmatium globosum]|uniref:Uncharacterized protein n=1 Tax=Rhizoclosmatium globosum TaxID=329046 RepID=A0A1Y2BXC1_9FUNG|nr:hypothetical protein BCR33DRAFT_853730 [Rhizoclosmatium globosum]|eukprot:ORY38745.1 hypothetical protein BCR33DRAFT_853730 [Rhizoclosmatium globosum]